MTSPAAAAHQLALPEALKATAALTDTEYALERSRLALGSSREIR